MPKKMNSIQRGIGEVALDHLSFHFGVIIISPGTNRLHTVAKGFRDVYGSVKSCFGLFLYFYNDSIC